MSDAALSDPWLALAVAVFVLAVLAMALFARRDKRPAASTDAKLDALDRRLSAAETNWSAADAKWKQTDHDVRSIRMIVNNLPTKESIHAIGVQVAESRGKMDGMQESLRALTHSTGRIEDFLTKVSAEAIVNNRVNGDRT